MLTKISQSRALSAATTKSAAKARFTIALYLDGDNDLESAACTDFYYEIFPKGTNKNVNFIVLFDRAAGYSTSNGNWINTRLYMVTPQGTTDGVYTYQDWQERNMGDASTVSIFTEYALNDFPADYNVLIMWDHGNGWQPPSKKGVALPAEEDPMKEARFPMPEHIAEKFQAASLRKTEVVSEPERQGVKDLCNDLNPADSLSLPELSQGLADSNSIIDIFSIDACLMGTVEVAYEVKDLAHFFVASEELISNTGFPYNLILDRITNAAVPDASALCSVLVDEFMNYYSNSSYTHSLTAWDLTDMGPLFSALEDLSNAFLNRLHRIPLAEREAFLNAAQHLGDANNFESIKSFDMGSLCHHILQNIQDSEVRSATQVLANRLVESRRVANWIHTSKYGDPTAMAGLSIYWQQNYDVRYSDPNNLAFADQSWNKAVRLLMDSTAPEPPAAGWWASPPSAASATSISMEANAATEPDDNTVYYDFAFTGSSTTGSGGTSSDDLYSSTTYIDDGLEPNHSYTYKVRAHDGANNETTYSNEASAVTLAAAPGAAPFSDISANSFTANWTSAGNAADTEYFCEVTSHIDSDSGWTQSLSWNVANLNGPHSFRVKARNRDLVETGWTSLGTLCVDLCLGDVNNDGLRNLQDVFICLQIVTGITPDETVYLETALGDNQLGLDEAIYIMQVIAKLIP